MRTFLGIPVALALATATLPAAVHAAANSQVTFSNFKISLIDLMPADGIGPSLRFVGEGDDLVVGPSSSGRVTILNATDGTEIYNEFFNNSGASAPFSTVSGQAAVANIEAYAAFTTVSPTSGPHDLRAQGHAQSPSANASAYYSAGVTAPSFYANSFEVSPYTLVLFEGSAELLASTNANSFNAVAGGAVELEATGIGISGAAGSRQLSTDKATISAQTGEFKSVIRLMSVSFHNNSALNSSGQFRVSASVSGYDLAAPVPEPANAALVLGGLAVLGLLACRKPG